MILVLNVQAWKYPTQKTFLPVELLVFCRYNYGYYKVMPTFNKKITADSVLEIYFNGVRYILSSHVNSFKAGALNSNLTAWGNHKIMKSFFNGTSATWGNDATKGEPFLITTNPWIATSTASSYTIRIDELIITDW